MFCEVESSVKKQNKKTTPVALNTEREQKEKNMGEKGTVCVYTLIWYDVQISLELFWHNLSCILLSDH